VRQTHLLASLGVMLAGALWGVLWLPLVEFEKQGLGVGLSSTIFYAVTALCALPALIIRREWGLLLKAPMSLAIMGIAFTFYTFSLLLTNPLNAILLFYLTPAWSIVLGKVFYGERISLVRGFVVLSAFAGIAFVLGATSLPFPSNLGDWIALSSGALWAWATSLTSREIGQHSWPRLMQFSIAGLLSTLILAFALSGLAPKVVAITADAKTLFVAAIVGLVLFALPNVLVIWATLHLSSARIGVLMMMEVVVGSVAIALFSSQPLVPLQIFGAALIIAAGIVEVVSRDASKTSTGNPGSISSSRT
jgi:drug/metabolite transporter (DMT)-like permease